MNLLAECQPALPSHYYHDPDHYRRELASIWYREWVCIGRDSEWANTGDYRRAEIGTQSVLVTRDETGALRAFHNTCRHRGSALCQESSGQFPRGRIVCPYHAWSYSLNGDLLATPRRVATPAFSAADYPLYRVDVATWGGFVFVNLSTQPHPTLLETLAEEADRAADWPLASLRIAHRESHRLACNWKVFWENYCECYHCPGTHPQLCRLVPIYAKSFVNPQDDPTSQHQTGMAGTRNLVEGAVTWSKDGKLVLPELAGLSDEGRTAGMRFITLFPTVFLVLHPDYVRSVRVVPQGPESVELDISWYVAGDQYPDAETIERLTAFGRQVVMEDAGVCEINQRGLHSLRHERGVLLPQEYGVLEFDNWVLDRLR